MKMGALQQVGEGELALQRYTRKRTANQQLGKENKTENVRYEAVTEVFWDVTSCRTCFANCCHHLQGWRQYVTPKRTYIYDVILQDCNLDIIIQRANTDK